MSRFVAGLLQLSGVNLNQAIVILCANPKTQVGYIFDWSLQKSNYLQLKNILTLWKDFQHAYDITVAS